MSGHQELDADVILQHSGFIRSLARGLLADQSLVDDVVQETLIKALQKGPRTRSALPAWLRTVTRNIAYKSYRGTARRRAREEEVARPEGLTATVDLVARGEALESLTASVMELPETAREVVFLRYYEGLSHGAIGAQLGLAPGTVRMRLHRAQKLLQERLDAESDGDRAAWMSGLAGLAGVGLRDIGGGAPQSSAVAPSSSAALAVATTAVLCLGVGAMFWLGTRPSDAMPPAESVELRAMASIAPNETDALLDVGVPNDRARHEAAPLVALEPNAAAHGDAATAVNAVFPDGDLKGTVVDESGVPVAGARVFGAWGRDPLEFRVETNQDGRFGIDVPTSVFDQAQDGSYSILMAATSEDSAPTRVHAWPHEAIDPSQDGDHVLLKLRGPGGEFNGVVRGSDGRPIVGALVRIGERRRLGMSFLGQQTATDENPLAPKLAIEVQMVGAPLFKGHRRMRGTLGLQALESDGTRSRLMPATEQRSKADGSFRFRGLELGQQAVSITAPDYAPYKGTVNVKEQSPGEVTFVLERGASLGGTIRRADGLPATKGLVHAFHENPSIVQTVRMQPDGSFLLKGLRSGPVRIVAEERLPREKHSPRIAAQSLTLSPGELRSITLEMHAPAVAHARVMMRSQGELVPVTDLALELRARANPVDLIGIYPLDEDGRATLPLETVRATEWVLTSELLRERGPNGEVLAEKKSMRSMPIIRMHPPTREEAAEEFLITIDEEDLMRGKVLVTPHIEGAGRINHRDGFSLFQIGNPFTYVSWSGDKPGQLQFNAVTRGEYHIIYPHHGLGWISPFTVHVGSTTPEKPQDLGSVQLPKLGSIALLLSDREAMGRTVNRSSTRWTDLDIQLLLPTEIGEVEIAMFRGRAEVPGTLEVSPGQYVVRDPSRPDLPAKYVNVRPGESAELAWH